MKTDRSLRAGLVRLAATHPEFRRDLAPLLRTAGPTLSQPEYGAAQERLYGIFGSLELDALIANLREASEISDSMQYKTQQVEALLRQAAALRQSVKVLMTAMEKEWGLD